MKTLLIVDDEIHAVEGLVSSLDWSALGLRVLTAYRQTEARRIFEAESVDLVLCDIEMPDGDGLELATWMKERRPNAEIIFLTCHADFNYARRAVQIGSVDYLLKPILPQDLSCVVQKALDRIGATESQNQLREYGTYWIRNRTGLLERFWLALFNQTGDNSREALWRLVDEQGLPYLETMRFRPVLIQMKNWQPTISLAEQRSGEWGISARAGALLQHPENGDCLVNLDRRSEVLILATLAGQEIDPERLRDDALAFVLSCREEFAAEVGVFIGEDYPLESVYDGFMSLRKADADLRPDHRPGVLAIPPDMSTWEILRQTSSADALIAKIAAYARAQEASGKLDAERDRSFARARRFIREHLAENISCDDIADFAGMNQDHLSRIFRRETGYSLSEYLIGERMKMASALLEESLLSVSTIALQVGYTNFSHFSRMFRRHTGMTPGEYRRSRPDREKK